MTTKLPIQPVKSTVGFPVIARKKSYWLISTQSGIYFESFYTHNYIAIEYDRISLLEIDNLKKQCKDDIDKFFFCLKNLCATAYPEENQPGLIASRLSGFIYGIKKDDIVSISSEDSKRIVRGRILQSPLIKISNNLFDKTGCPYTFRKPVEWFRMQSMYNPSACMY